MADPRLFILKTSCDLFLPDALRPQADAIFRLAAAGRSDASAASAKSAWTLWLAFSSQHKFNPVFPSEDPHFPLYQAAFVAWLAEGSAGRTYSSDTICQYASQVRAVIAASLPESILKAVKVGLPRAIPPRPPPVELSLHHLCTIMAAGRRPGASFPCIRNALLVGYLACTISRSQSATVRVINGLARGVVLTCADVIPGQDRTHIGFAQRASKGDTAGRRLGADGANWNYWWSSPGHPLDGMSLYDLYVSRLRASGTYAPAAPFFQMDTSGSPDGSPLTYAEALRCFRVYLAHEFPLLGDAGLHSLRRLGATLAHMKGLPPDLVQFQGGWSSLVYQRYLRLTRADRLSIARHIIESDVQPMRITPAATHNRPLHHMQPVRYQ